MKRVPFKATNAELYSFIHENEAAECPLGLYWNLRVELCAESNIDAPQSLGCEWLTFKSKDWRALENASQADIVVPSMVETTLYTNWHQCAQLEMLRFGRRSGAEFAIDVGIALDLEHADGRIETDVGVVVSTTAKYLGAIVVPANLTPKPSSPELAAAVLARFVAPGSHEAPLDEKFRYRFPPAVSA